MHADFRSQNLTHFNHHHFWQEIQRTKVSPCSFKCSRFAKLSGYNVTAAEKALIATKNEGVQPAIDW